MTSISAIIWGDSDRLARREGGVTVGQVVFPPVMRAEARAEVARIKERDSKPVSQPRWETVTFPPMAKDPDIEVTLTRTWEEACTDADEQERRAQALYERAMARRERNSTGLG